jgi:UDP-N-acetylglucosamine--N-acetylmuramyl-(pentapeptide) pyrophosphoryl-undecaprenol N-acetylglucosamine transferase
MAKPTPRTARAMIAGGGTGGHVYPGIAIYEALHERFETVDALFVGVHGGMEEQIFAAHGLPHVLIAGRGLRGASLSTKLRAPFALAHSVRQALRALHAFRPEVVVGTGGYASASAVIAAIIARVPVVLQEQNSVPGLVNRRLARFAELVLLSYEESRAWFPKRVATAVIGNPLRRMPGVDRATAAKYFGLDPDRTTVLVIGGSRGAHSLNVAGCRVALALAAERDVQSILLTGERDYEFVRTALGGVADRVKVMAYLNDVHMGYAVADVAVARAGASTVFELAATGVPTLFVPYPFAADDHQTQNVAALVEQGAAVLIADAELDAARLQAELRALLDDDERRAGMSRSLRNWARPDAAVAAAGLVADVIKKNSMRAEREASSPEPLTMTAPRRATLRVVRR